MHILDHEVSVEDNSAPEYYVYGRIHSMTRLEIVLDWWAHIDPANSDRAQGRQIESARLLRCAIQEIVILVPRTAMTNPA